MMWYSAMIDRSRLQARVARALKRSRVVALVGPRQSGKTTLARQIVTADSTNYFDLENPASLARLAVHGYPAARIYQNSITDREHGGTNFRFRARAAHRLRILS